MRDTATGTGQWKLAGTQHWEQGNGELTGTQHWEHGNGIISRDTAPGSRPPEIGYPGVDT